MQRPNSFFFFFFNDTATTEIYTLSLHDALPILNHLFIGRLKVPRFVEYIVGWQQHLALLKHDAPPADRKSTRLNSSHSQISYAVFCLKKKKKTRTRIAT